MPLTLAPVMPGSLSLPPAVTVGGTYGSGTYGSGTYGGAGGMALTVVPVAPGALALSLAPTGSLPWP